MNVKSLLRSDKDLSNWFKYAFKRWNPTSKYNTEDIGTMVDILKCNFGFTDDNVLAFANATHTLNHMYF